MKLLIYVILFVVLLIYINNHSKKLTQEEFTDGLFNKGYEAVNPYDMVDNNLAKHYQYEDLDKSIVAFNENPPNSTQLNNWIIRNSDYSDIFNGQDMGGEQINATLNFAKPKNFLDKAMQKISIDNKDKPDNEKTLAEVHSKQIVSETIPELKQVIGESLYPTEIRYDKLVYNLLGYVYNTHYRQYYLLYETKNSQIHPNLVLREKLDNLESQLFTYALVKIEKSVPVIKFIFGPRAKININDVVYLSQGSFQMGPLIVDNI
jgi:hypothetical protein